MSTFVNSPLSKNSVKYSYGGIDSEVRILPEIFKHRLAQLAEEVIAIKNMN
jgi:hypothetical protein